MVNINIRGTYVLLVLVMHFWMPVICYTQQVINVSDYEEITIPCNAIKKGAWIINNNEEYSDIFIHNWVNFNCPGFSPPSIDFNRYTLLLFYRTVGGGHLPKVTHSLILDSEGYYSFNIEITVIGLEEPGNHIKMAYLIPKTDASFVKFNIQQHTELDEELIKKLKLEQK
jgi:hypothetical protein